jgi:hypothetical protein
MLRGHLSAGFGVAAPSGHSADMPWGRGPIILKLHEEMLCGQQIRILINRIYRRKIKGKGAGLRPRELRNRI